MICLTSIILYTVLWVESNFISMLAFTCACTEHRCSWCLWECKSLYRVVVITQSEILTWWWRWRNNIQKLKNNLHLVSHCIMALRGHNWPFFRLPKKNILIRRNRQSNYIFSTMSSRFWWAIHSLPFSTYINVFFFSYSNSPTSCRSLFVSLAFLPSVQSQNPRQPKKGSTVPFF